MRYYDLVVQKTLIAFIIDDTGNETRRIHLLENQWPYIKQCRQPALYSSNFAEWSRNGALANGFSAAHILQFCILTKPWR